MAYVRVAQQLPLRTIGCPVHGVVVGRTCNFCASGKAAPGVLAHQGVALVGLAASHVGRDAALEEA